MTRLTHKPLSLYMRKRAQKMARAHARPVALSEQPGVVLYRMGRETASKGAIRCEDWPEQFPLNRIKDAAWPWHPKGRPVVDITKVAA